MMGESINLKEWSSVSIATLLTLAMGISLVALPIKFSAVIAAGILFGTSLLLMPNKRLYLLILILLTLPLDVTKTFFKFEGEVASLSDNIELYAHEILAILLLTSIIFRRISSPSDRPCFSIDFLTGPLLLWFMIATFSTIFSESIILSICEGSRMIKGIILYYAILLSIECRKDLTWVIVTMGISILIQGILAVLEVYVLKHPVNFSFVLVPDIEGLVSMVGQESVLRAGGSIGHANSFSLFFELQLPMMLTLLFNSENTLLRNFPIPVLLMGLMGLALAMSRMGIMLAGLSFAAGFYWIARENFSKKQFLWKTWCVILLGICLVAALTPLLLKRFTHDDAGSADSRVYQFEVAAKVIDANPLFGVGLNNYKHVMDQYDDTVIRIAKTFPYPVHNIYLLTTAEMGPIGLLTLFILIGSIAWKGIQNTKHQTGVFKSVNFGALLGMMVYFFHINVDMINITRLPIFFVMAALMASVDRLGQAPKSAVAKKNYYLLNNNIQISKIERLI